MFDSRQANLQLLSSLAFLLLFSHADGTAPGLEGSLAACTVENEVIDLPILAGNPCFVCRCKNKSVECAREVCPRINTCKGIIKRQPGRCCPVCQENQGPTSCTHEGRTYKNNESWFAKGCQICFCVNGTTSCKFQKCSSPESLKCPDGKKPGQVPGGCCPQCIEGLFKTYSQLKRAHGTDEAQAHARQQKPLCIMNDVMAWLPLDCLSVAWRASTEVN
ncbi:hypothetical protein ACROYT_G035028 [Oculina patagonica]